MLLFHFAVCIFDFTVVYQFANNFLSNKRTSLAAKSICVLTAAALLVVANLFKISWLNPVIYCILSFILISSLFESTFLIKLAFPIFALVLSGATEFVTGFLLSIVHETPLQSTDIFLSYDSIIPVTLSKIAFWGIVIAIKICYPKNQYKAFSIKAICLLSLPISSSIILYSLLYFEEFLTSSFSNTIILLFICVLQIVVNLVVFNVYDDQMKTTELRSQLEGALIAQRKTEEYYRTQESNLKKIYSLIHDFKNHLLLIQGMFLVGDENLGESINHLCGKFMDQSIMIKKLTDNNAINIVIYQKEQECIADNIEMKVNINYPTFKFLDYSDACTLLGNALDNAIAACASLADENKFITITFTRHNDMAFIEIENSRNETDKILNDNQIFRSTKKDNITHGYGIFSMQECIKKYSGRVILNYTEKTFVATIMFIIKTDTVQT